MTCVYQDDKPYFWYPRWLEMSVYFRLGPLDVSLSRILVQDILTMAIEIRQHRTRFCSCIAPFIVQVMVTTED
jgi:hypothetical protein